MEQRELLELRKKYIEQRFPHLNERQLEAALHTEGPLLILAGAGSGKTTVLVNRICNLVRFGSAYSSDFFAGEPSPRDIERLRAAVASGAELSPELERTLKTGGVEPYNILAITFTNKAADELKSRIASVVGEGGRDVFASTFHSACARFLRRDILHIGKPQNFTIYDADDSLRAMKETYKRLGIDDKMIAPKQMLAKIGRLKDKMISPEECAERAYDFSAKLTANVYAAYQKLLFDNGALDFDDLIYDTVRILDGFPSVREYYNRRFRYILVDEYQDTSYAQFRLVELLTNESGNICVVGDDDQSIYRFRGATIENILSFEDCFKGARTIRLEQNYRSTGNILDCANSVISNNRSRKGKTLWTAFEAGSKIDFYIADNEEDEAAYIARSIASAAALGERLRDFAVLYRMNAQSNAIESYLMRAGVPYKIVGGLRFFDRAEIRDLISYMSIVNNRADDVRLLRIINRPARKIGDSTIAELSRIAAGSGVSILDVIERAAGYETLSRPRAALEGFYAMYGRLVSVAESGSLLDFTRAVIEDTGYAEYLKAQGDEGEERLKNAMELLSTVKSYCDSALEPTLEEFLEQVALIASIDTLDTGSDRVTLMTLHCAKGLEYKNVFIPGLEEGIFPSELSKISEEDIEEERRLMYVGVTRAKRSLTLIACDRRMLFGMTRRNRVSRFVDEIDEELLNPVGRIAARPKRPVYTPAPPIASAVSTGRPAPRSDAEEYKNGERVRHKVFGDGTVVSVKPIGSDWLLEVDFDTKGVKKMMQNYAPLTKI